VKQLGDSNPRVRAQRCLETSLAARMRVRIRGNPVGPIKNCVRARKASATAAN